MPADKPLALSGLRAVEVGTGLSIAYATKLLAALGADVVAVRPPGAERCGPDGVPPGLWSYLDAGKTVVTIGGSSGEDLAAVVAEVVAGADLIVEDLGAGQLERLGVGPDVLRRTTPGLSTVRLAPEGQGSGTRISASPLTLQAAAGWVNRHDARVTGGVPFQVGGSYAEMAVGGFVSAACLSVLCAADRMSGGGSDGPTTTGSAGADVDISIAACLHSMLQRTRMRIDFAREMGVETSGIGHQALAIHHCKDGWVGINILTGQQWSDACLMLDLAQFADKQAAIGEDSVLRADFEARVNAWCAGQHVTDVVELAQAFRIPAAPLSDGRTVLEVRQLVERGFFRPLNGVDGGPLEPGPPWRASVMPLSNRPPVQARPDELPVWPARTARPSPVTPRPGSLPGDGVLAGVRVVDLGNFYAAPYGTQFLGALGADIVKIESSVRPDGFRFVGTSPAFGPDWHERSMMFQATNLNKRSTSIDLSTAAGRDLVLRLVEDADVVTENFSARVMDNFGLDWDTLQARNPRLVMVRMPGFGLSGPWRDFVGFGPGFEQTGGLATLTGEQTDPPSTPGGYLDPVVGMHAVTAILGALAYRNRTGSGQLIELVQVEVATCMNVEQVLRWTGQAELAGRQGNRSAVAAPQGVYPCLGGSGWVALTVRSDGDWRALCAALHRPEWTEHPAWSTLAGRQRAHDELDRHLAAWTATRPGAEVTAILQAAGVPAATVLSPSSYLEDDHLRAWGYYQPLDHPVTGRRDYPGLPFRAPFIPHHRTRPPLLGEHSVEVLTSLLGLSDEEVAELVAEGVVGGPPVIAG